MKMRTMSLVGGFAVLLSVGTSGIAGAEQPTGTAGPDSSLPVLVQSPQLDGRLSPGPEAPDLSADSPVDDVIPPVAERLFELGADRGFVGQRTDYQNRAITVYWKGLPPKDVVDFVESRPLGVDVRIVTGRKYSRAEGNAARDRLLNAPIAKEIGIVSISVKGDGSGLAVAVMANQDKADSMTQSIQEAAGILDITVEAGVPEAIGFAGSRTNDVAPYKGGGRTIYPYYGWGCTTGFSVLSGSAGRILSARHCDLGGGHSLEDGGGTQIAPSGGDSVRVYGPLDSAIIDPVPSPASTHQTFRGGYAAQSTWTVKNWYSNWDGDTVCTSGASMGERCGQVYDDNDSLVFNGYSIPTIQVTASTPLSGHGDSGGPVYKTVTGGVQARGIIAGPDLTNGHTQTTTCGTHDPAMVNFECTKYVNYVPISSILSHWGVTLDVG